MSTYLFYLYPIGYGPSAWFLVRHVIFMSVSLVIALCGFTVVTQCSLTSFDIVFSCIKYGEVTGSS